MKARQPYCSFYRLYTKVRGGQQSIQDEFFDNLPLIVQYYTRNLKREGDYELSYGGRVENVYNIEKARGFRLAITRLYGGGFNLEAPTFQLMPAPEEVPTHRKRQAGQAIPIKEANPTLF
jgi:hypothetical protein